ncbi:MAG: hypothetical protein NW206_01760 [Hyphomonadaceae bacterium]|nr:hypothetical protein [Hyphomonadaceae bacterium]
MAALALQIATIGAVLGLPAMLWAGWVLVRRWSGLAPRTRRWALIAFGTFELAYWLNVYAWLIEPRMLVVQRVEIVSEQWRGAPVTLALLSDTHVPSPHMDSARAGRIVARINQLQPDLVLLLGDYVGGRGAEAERTPETRNEVMAGIATFAGLNAPLGAVAVLGNRDNLYSRASIMGALEQAGVAALWDRHVVISRPGGDIVVVGLADDVTAAPDYARAIDGAPENADMLVLSHTPDEFLEVPAGAALLLAGHTHCGQVTIPLIGRPDIPLAHKEYACHRIDEPGRIIYVTGGVGTSLWPVRFLNPPEIVLIQLRGANAAPEQGGVASG